MSRDIKRNHNQEVVSDKIQIQRTVKALKSKWYVPLLLVVLAVGLVKIYTRYRNNSFVSEATVEIIDDNSASEFLSADLFETAFTRTDKILTEAEVIKTKNLVERALVKMQYKINYSKVGPLNSYPLYRRTPVVLYTLSRELQRPKYTYNIEILSQTRYKLKVEFDENEQIIEGGFGEQKELNGEKFSIEVSADQYAHELEAGNKYRFKPVNVLDLVPVVQKRLLVTQPRERVSILNINFSWNNPIFARDFLSSLCEVYLEDELQSKSETATNVISFIDNQLKTLSEEVNNYEARIADFKEENNLVNIEGEASQSMQTIYQLEAEKRLVDIELMNLRSFKAQLSQKSSEKLSSISTKELVDPYLIKLVTNLNELQLARINQATTLGPKNRRLQETDAQIEELMKTLEGNINSSISRLQESSDFIQSKIDKVFNQYKDIPDFQREYMNLSRNFEVNEKVLALLLERKLSAQISKASITANAKLLDGASLNIQPNAMSETKLILIASSGAFIIAISIIAFLSFFDDKVYDKQDIEEDSNLSVIGVVTKTKVDKENTIVRGTDRGKSIFSESVNSLRTNLEFFVPEMEGSGAKVITTSSTVSGEGKSFVSANLANSFVNLGKKVLLVDLDMRKPKVHKFFDAANDSGVSNVLTGNKALSEVIRVSDNENFHYITSGVIPPNPIELLQSESFAKMVDEAKSMYEIIILDTPPIGIVSDGLFAMKLSSCSIYVLRANYSRRSFLALPQETIEKYNLKNFYIVLNEFTQSNSAYGTGYSAYYYKSGYFEDDGKGSGLGRLFKRT